MVPSGLEAAARAQALPEEPSGWSVVRSTRGKCRLVGPGGDPVEVVLGEEMSVSCSTALPGGEGLLLGGMGEEGEGRIVMVEGPSFEKIRWKINARNMVQRMVSSPDGGWVLAVENAGASVVRVLDGKVLGHLSGSSAGVAIDASGELLARVGRGGVQIWETAALLARPAGALRSARGGWVSAAFSPDGRRLLTGELLCDAVDGRIIAVLELDSPGLDGGPPEGAQMLTDERHVEMAPGGVSVFDSRTGERLLQDRSRSYFAGRDEVELSPDGLHYVHFSPDGGKAMLLRVDDGLPLALLSIKDPFIACFSADGRRVAVGSHHGMIGLWGVPSGRLVARFDFGGELVGLWLSGSGDRVVAGALHAAWKAWRVEGGAMVEMAPGQDAMEFREAWGVGAGEPGPFELRGSGGVFEVVRREDGRVMGLISAWGDGPFYDGDRSWAGRLGHWRLEEGSAAPARPAPGPLAAGGGAGAG